MNQSKMLDQIRIQLEVVLSLKEEEQAHEAYQALTKTRDIVNFWKDKTEVERKFTEFFRTVTGSVLRPDLNDTEHPGIGMMRLQYIKVLLGYLDHPADIKKDVKEGDGPLGNITIYGVPLKKSEN